MPEKVLSHQSSALSPEGQAAAPDDYGRSDGEWLGIDWRRHLRSIEVLGTPVTYVEMGPDGKKPAPPIVFVHGLSGCWQNWLENIPRFASSHRVLALDLPGFGASPMPPWDIDIPAYGRLLSSFCSALEVGPCVLVGNSMGGFIAAETTINHPDQVERLVLVSAAGISQTEVRRAPLLAFARITAAAGPAMLENARRSVSRPGLRQASYGMVFRYPNRLRPELLFEQHVNGVGRPGFLPALRALMHYDFRDRLPEIEMSTLVVWGRNDQIVPAVDADEFERLIPNSAKVIMEKTGHVPQMERPERFNRILEQFIVGELADALPRGTPTIVRRRRGIGLMDAVLTRDRAV